MPISEKQLKVCLVFCQWTTTLGVKKVSHRLSFTKHQPIFVIISICNKAITTKKLKSHQITMSFLHYLWHTNVRRVVCSVCQSTVLLKDELARDRDSTYGKQQLLWRKHLVIIGSINLNSGINRCQTGVAKFWYFSDWLTSFLWQEGALFQRLLCCCRQVCTVQSVLLWIFGMDTVNSFSTMNHMKLTSLAECFFSDCFERLVQHSGLLQSILGMANYQKKFEPKSWWMICAIHLAYWMVNF